MNMYINNFLTIIVKSKRVYIVVAVKLVRKPNFCFSLL